jgi:hypothetical protein
MVDFLCLFETQFEIPDLPEIQLSEPFQPQDVVTLICKIQDFPFSLK